MCGTFSSEREPLHFKKNQDKRLSVIRTVSYFLLLSHFLWKLFKLRWRIAGNLAPCACAGLVVYKGTLPRRTRCKTRPCSTLHPPIADKAFFYVWKNMLYGIFCLRRTYLYENKIQIFHKIPDIIYFYATDITFQKSFRGCVSFYKAQQMKFCKKKTASSWQTIQFLL